MRVLGFSGIDNGEFYRLRYGLRFVGHDAAVALVVDGKLDPVCLPSMDDLEGGPSSPAVLKEILDHAFCRGDLSSWLEILEGAALSDDSEDFWIKAQHGA